MPASFFPFFLPSPRLRHTQKKDRSETKAWRGKKGREWSIHPSWPVGCFCRIASETCRQPQTWSYLLLFVLIPLPQFRRFSLSFSLSLSLFSIGPGRFFFPNSGEKAITLSTSLKWLYMEAEWTSKHSTLCPCPSVQCTEGAGFVVIVWEGVCRRKIRKEKGLWGSFCSLKSAVEIFSLLPLLLQLV